MTKKPQRLPFAVLRLSLRKVAAGPRAERRLRYIN